MRGNLGRLDRTKVVNILTVEVHAREVIDKMVKVLLIVGSIVQLKAQYSMVQYSSCVVVEVHAREVIDKMIKVRLLTGRSSSC